MTQPTGLGQSYTRAGITYNSMAVPGGFAWRPPAMSRGSAPAAPTSFSSLPLLNQGSFSYLGSFRMPQGSSGGMSAPMNYSEDRQICYNPNNNSLFVIGNNADLGDIAKFSPIAEVAIPGTLSTSSTLSNLPVATYIQTPRSLAQFLTPPLGNWAAAEMRIGGVAFDDSNDTLIVSMYHYYASTIAVASKTIVSSNISSWSSGNVMQPFSLTGSHTYTPQGGGSPVTLTLGGGFFGMYSSPMPAEWQTVLGKPWMCGCTGISIVERTSAAPCAFGWDPNNISTPAERVVSNYSLYPIADITWGFSGAADHANGKADGNPSPIFNAKTKAWGGHCVPTTRTMLFTGENTSGYIYYGWENTNLDIQTYTNGLQDDVRSGHGYHAVTSPAGWRKWPISEVSGQRYDSVGSAGNHGSYQRHIWLFDADDYRKVKEGIIQPRDVMPYAHFDPPATPIQDPRSRGGSSALDSANRKLYFESYYEDTVGFSVQNLIHVFSY